MKKVIFLIGVFAMFALNANSKAVAATCNTMPGGTGNNYTIGNTCSSSNFDMLSNCMDPYSTGCVVNQCNSGDICSCGSFCDCNNGYYSKKSGSSSVCEACPDGGSSQISGWGPSAITDCYKVTGIYNASIHGHKAQTCYANLSGSYTTNCQITGMYACDAGYYLANTTDMFCTAVGANYYSPAGSLTRTLCEPYTNPSGGSSYGQTAGGTEADAINDCRIPISEVYSDTTGKWVYDPYCKYQ